MSLNHTTSTHAQAGEFRDDDRFSATQPSTDPTAAGGSGAERSEAEPAHEPPSSGASFYLETDRNTVPKKLVDTESCITVEQHFEVRPCRCKSRICPRCGKALGIQTSHDLKPVLKTFVAIQMWTLTIDPAPFRNAEEAYAYAKKKRAISKWVDGLYKRGQLNSRRYFYVVEFHKNGWAHFHILLDTKRVDFGVACELWNKNVPPWVGPASETRVGFGGIHFSPEKDLFVDSDHAANYACKYLINQPKNGYPEWVMKRSHIRFYDTSRFLLPKRQSRKPESEAAKSKKKSKAAPHREDCFCSECRGDVEAATDLKPPPRTNRERVKRCRQEVVILRVTSFIKPDGQVVEQRDFVRNMKVPYAKLVAHFGKTEKECRALEATLAELDEFEADYMRSKMEARAA